MATPPHVPIPEPTLGVAAYQGETVADLGNYIQVAKLGQMLLIVPQIIASVVFPRTASGFDRQRINHIIMVMARLFSQLFLLLFIAVLLLQYVVEQRGFAGSEKAGENGDRNRTR